jgi:hypothetical protein
MIILTQRQHRTSTAGRARAKAKASSIRAPQYIKGNWQVRRTCYLRFLATLWTRGTRIAGRETLTQLWLCLYAHRQTARTAEVEGNLETLRSFGHWYRKAIERIPTSISERDSKEPRNISNLPNIPWRLYLANIARLYQQEQAAREVVNKRRTKYRGRNLDTANISRKSVLDTFVEFLLPELRKRETDTYETAKTRFLKQ